MSDALVARLRARAEDPDRRVDVPPGSLAMGREILDLGSLMRGKASSARRTSLPAPVDGAALARAEGRLGRALPAFVRRLYAEIADGRFGPRHGLMPLERIVATYERLRAASPGPPRSAWPASLLPLLGDDASYICVDLDDGRAVGFDADALPEEWDPDAPNDAAAERAWQRCFTTMSPSVEAWLEAWLAAPSIGERMAARADEAVAARQRELRERVARYEAMTPEERRTHIDDERWEILKIAAQT